MYVKPNRMKALREKEYYIKKEVKIPKGSDRNIKLHRILRKEKCFPKTRF